MWRNASIPLSCAWLAARTMAVMSRLRKNDKHRQNPSRPHAAAMIQAHLICSDQQSGGLQVKRKKREEGDCNPWWGRHEGPVSEMQRRRGRVRQRWILSRWRGRHRAGCRCASVECLLAAVGTRVAFCAMSAAGCQRRVFRLVGWKIPRAVAACRRNRAHAQ